METLIPYFVWAALIIGGLGVIAIAVFSLRSVFYGKTDPLSVVIVAVPLALFVILGLVMEDWSLAGIWTFLVVFAIATLSLFLAGARSFFT